MGPLLGFGGGYLLQLASHRQRLREARAAKWYEATANVIGELHNRLVKVDHAFDRIKRPHVAGDAEPLRALGREAQERGRELEEFFWENRIRLDKSDCQAMELFLRELAAFLDQYHTLLDAPYPNPADEFRDLNVLTGRVVTKVRPLCQSLEERFRALLK